MLSIEKAVQSNVAQCGAILFQKLREKLWARMVCHSDSEGESSSNTSLTEQISNLSMELRERQNLSRFDSAMFLLMPITTLGIALSTNWLLDQERYFSFGFPINFILGSVIAVTIGSLAPTVAVYAAACLRDTVALRIKAVKLLLITNGSLTFMMSLLIVAYVGAFVGQYDRGLIYQMTGLGAVTVNLAASSLPYGWLYIRCLIWFKQKVPTKFGLENLTPWSGNQADANRLFLLALKAGCGTGLILMSVGGYFALLIRYTHGDLGYWAIVGWASLFLLLVVNSLDVVNLGLLIHKSGKKL